MPPSWGSQSDEKTPGKTGRLTYLRPKDLFFCECVKPGRPLETVGEGEAGQLRPEILPHALFHADLMRDSSSDPDPVVEIEQEAVLVGKDQCDMPGLERAQEDIVSVNMPGQHAFLDQRAKLRDVG